MERYIEKLMETQSLIEKEHLTAVLEGL